MRRPAALLRGLLGDLLPAGGLVFFGIDPDDRSRGNEREKRGDTQLRRLLDDEIHLVAFEDRLGKEEGSAG